MNINQVASKINAIYDKALNNVPLAGNPVYMQPESQLAKFRNEAKKMTEGMNDEDFLKLEIADVEALIKYNMLMEKGGKYVEVVAD